MAKVSKSGAVREVLQANPGIDAGAAVQLVKDGYGVEVTKQTVYAEKSKLGMSSKKGTKKKGTKKKASKKKVTGVTKRTRVLQQNTSGTDYQTLLEAKKFVDMCGSPKQAKSAIDSLESLLAG